MDAEVGDQVAWLRQVHGKEIVIVDSPGLYTGDGAITATKGLTLAVQWADCQGALFEAPGKVGVVHAGWRGLVHNIYREMVEALACDPAQISVWIGPSLEPEHSEFRNYQTEFPESLHRFQWKPNYFDLWAIAEWQLQEAGVQDIHIARIGTYGNKAYPSYRRDKTTHRCTTFCRL